MQLETTQITKVVIIDLRQPNTSIITTKPDQLITVTIQAGVMT